MRLSKLLICILLVFALVLSMCLADESTGGDVPSEPVQQSEEPKEPEPEKKNEEKAIEKEGVECSDFRH